MYELYHYGVPGMRWGKRKKYLNEDGTLSNRGMKRISKQYNREMTKVNKDLNKQYNRMYADAYNKSANAMNSGGIDKFNAEQRKKYGENFHKRNGYLDDYDKIFNDLVNRNLDKSLSDFYKGNKHFKKAKELADKYTMSKWDKLAKENEPVMKNLGL